MSFSFECPITREVPRIAAVTDHGVAYDFFALVKNMLNTGSLSDPMVRLEIETINVIDCCDEGFFSNKLKKAIARACLSLEEHYPFIKINGLSNLSGVDYYMDKLIPEKPVLLYRLIKEGHIERLQRCIAADGMTVNSNAASGQETLLYIACFYGQTTLVQWLLSQETILVNKGKSERNITPLYVAAARGHLDIVIALLEKSATNVNQTTALVNRLSPLAVAAEAGHIEIVKVLLDDPRLTFSHVINAFRVARENDQVNVVALLLEYYCLKIIENPSSVAALFQTLPETLNTLRPYRDEFWMLLKQLRESNCITSGDFYALLQAINASTGQTEEQQHPFFNLFKGQKRRTFFTVNIMGQIQTILHEQASVNSVLNLTESISRSSTC